MNRRRYPRVKAPVFFKSSRFFARRSRVVDIGLGGMRVYSDEPFKIGHSMDIELLLPTGETLSCQVKVVWLGLLGEDGPAKYDVGLQLEAVHGDRLHLLAAALEPMTSRPELHVA